MHDVTKPIKMTIISSSRELNTTKLLVFVNYNTWKLMT